MKQRKAILAGVHMTNLRRMKERLKERRRERVLERITREMKLIKKKRRK